MNDILKMLSNFDVPTILAGGYFVYKLCHDKIIIYDKRLEGVSLRLQHVEDKLHEIFVILTKTRV